jgi:ribosome biogenesis GTPase
MKCIPHIPTMENHLQTRRNVNPSQAVVGDHVLFSLRTDGMAVIQQILPRRNQFTRRASRPYEGAYAHEQVIVANIDQTVVVTSADNPPPGWNMIDRYLVTAEASEMEPIICINKIDLSIGADGLLPDEIRARVADYRAIGYRVICVSAETGDGMEMLIHQLRDSTSVFLGKSGVGKTSLLNILIPGINHRTNEVSSGRLHRGQHTTTDLEMFTLNNGGYLIDTPGMREFGLWSIEPDDLPACFPEMRPFIGQCRFGLDCAHNEEPGCAVRKAVVDGKISPHRYKSYLKMRNDP